MPTLVQRLERHHRVTEGGCWEWTLSTRAGGYGQIGVGSRNAGTKTMRKVHQVAWELFRGPIPEGRDIDHLCRNRRCFNPEHLRPCTHSENVMALGSEWPAAVNARKTHCIHGHPLSGADLYVGPDGKRVCRACKRINDRRRRPPGSRAKGGGLEGPNTNRITIL